MKCQDYVYEKESTGHFVTIKHYLRRKNYENKKNWYWYITRHYNICKCISKNGIKNSENYYDILIAYG